MAGREVKGAKDLGVASDKQLRRALGKFELLYLSLGGIIGSGWLFASLKTATYAGGAAVLSWIIAGILVMFIGLSYAEIGSAIPKSGGLARYPHYTHGGVVGYLITWAYFLSASSVPAIEATAAIQYLGAIYPQLVSNGFLTPLGLALAILLLLFFFLLNYLGVHILGKVTHGVGWWKLLVPTITVVLLLALSFHPSNFTLGGGFFPSAEYVKGGSSGISGFSAVLYAIPTAGVIFSYLGFRQSVEYGGEGRNPQKDIPFAVLGSLGIAIVLYTLLQVAFIGGINWNALNVTPGDWTALISSKLSSGPYLVLLQTAPAAGFVSLILLGWSYFLLIDAVVSPSGTGWIYAGTSTRTIYAFASNGYLPEIFLKIGKTKIPTYSLITALIIGIIFLLPFPSWYALVGFISSATVLTYIMGGIGLAVLRKQAPDLNRPFKTPAASIVAPLATLAAGLVLYWSGFSTLFYVFTAVFIGLPIFMFYYASKMLGVNRVLATTVGIVDLAIDAGLAYYLYIATYNPSTHTYLSAPNNLAFAIYIVVIAAMLIGTLAFLVSAVPKEVKREINAAWWYIGFLLAIYILSYFGQFGLIAQVAQPPIPFPWDTVIAAIVILGFHYWAVNSGYRTEAIEEIIEETRDINLPRKR